MTANKEARAPGADLGAATRITKASLKALIANAPRACISNPS
jgi:hypothetical protein